MHEALDWDGQLKPLLEQYTAEGHAACGCDVEGCAVRLAAHAAAVARIERLARVR